MRGPRIGAIVVAASLTALLAALTPCLHAAALPSPSADNYVDLGNPADESYHNLQGWGGSQTPPANPFVSPSGDRTKRYQSLRGSNSVDLFVPQAGRQYVLVAEVEDGGCVDSFQLLVNGQGPLYSYAAHHLGNQAIVHTVAIAASVITSQRVTITFKNVAPDNCGLAAVYNVSLVSTYTPLLVLLLPWQDGQGWHRGVESFHSPPGVDALDFFPPDYYNVWGGSVVCVGDARWRAVESGYWVVSAAAGTVTQASNDRVIIDHGNGWSTGYYHLHSLQVGVGDRIPPKWALGHPSTYGWCGTGAHVHFWAQGPNGQTLRNVRISGRDATSIGYWELISNTGNYGIVSIGAGQSAALGASLAAGTGATFRYDMSGSDIVMTVISPSGRVYDRGTIPPDMIYAIGPGFESYYIPNNEAGDWQVRLFGADIASGGEDVVMSVIVDSLSEGTPTPEPTPAPHGVGGVVLLPPAAVSGASGDRSGDSGGPAATWVVLTGAVAGILAMGGWYARRRWLH